LGRRVGPGSEQDFATNVGDRIYFVVDQADLTPEAEDVLSKQAAWLQQYPGVTIQMEGHSDERGTREYNIAFRRGAATARSSSLPRLKPAAFPPLLGKDALRLCDAEQCWSQNRRAVTVIQARKDELTFSQALAGEEMLTLTRHNG
jgi:peptidoglycan-associated lipoprotein